VHHPNGLNEPNVVSWMIAGGERGAADRRHLRAVAEHAASLRGPSMAARLRSAVSAFAAGRTAANPAADCCAA
jgi:hypothetical protein